VRVLDTALHVARVDFQVDARRSAGQSCRGNGAGSDEGSHN
jgi:hypothetical protein